VKGLRGMDEKLEVYSQVRDNTLLCCCVAGQSYQSPTSQPASSVPFLRCSMSDIVPNSAFLRPKKLVKCRGSGSEIGLARTC
jgi:hypothetical protein